MHSGTAPMYAKYLGRLVASLAFTTISAIAGTEPSTVTLTSSLNPSVVSQTVTLTAQVAPASLADSASNARKGLLLPRCAGQCIPSGTVTFYDGETLIGTGARYQPIPHSRCRGDPGDQQAGIRSTIAFGVLLWRRFLCGKCLGSFSADGSHSTDRHSVTFAQRICGQPVFGYFRNQCWDWARHVDVF